MPMSFSVQSKSTYRPFLAQPSSSSSLLVALLRLSESHLLFFQSPSHSLCVYPGWHPERFPVFRSPLATRHSPLTSLESALTRSTSLTPLESALTKRASRKSFRIRTYEKNRGVGDVMLTNAQDHSGAARRGGRHYKEEPLPLRAWWAGA
jgi:hypothetical protein